MMKKDSNNLGIVIPKKIRVGETTLYLRQGQVVGCPAKRKKKENSFTLSQFKQRQKMRHSTALWKMLKVCDVMFTEHKNACLNFISLANRLPVVYVPNNGLMSHASFLMPDIPVSDGVLPVVKQELGEVDDKPALITNLKTCEEPVGERFLFYTAEQHIEGSMPRVRFAMREMSRLDMAAVDGHYVIKGDDFADDMKGWALVQVIGDRCSPQGIVTRCKYYEQYTTKEALETATEHLEKLRGCDF